MSNRLPSRRRPLTCCGSIHRAGPLISVSNSSKILVTGTPTHQLSYQGERWWDGFGGHPGGKVKPRAFRVNGLNDSKIVGLVLKNTPKMAFSVSKVRNFTFENITLDNADGIAGKKSKNGDGFGESCERERIMKAGGLTGGHAKRRHCTQQKPLDHQQRCGHYGRLRGHQLWLGHQGDE